MGGRRAERVSGQCRESHWRREQHALARSNRAARRAACRATQRAAHCAADGARSGEGVVLGVAPREAT